MKIVVIGSSNIDMVAQVSHLPAPGETVGDACFMQLLGGKGQIKLLRQHGSELLSRLSLLWEMICMRIF